MKVGSDDDDEGPTPNTSVFSRLLQPDVQSEGSFFAACSLNYFYNSPQTAGPTLKIHTAARLRFTHPAGVSAVTMTTADDIKLLAVEAL